MKEIEQQSKVFLFDSNDALRITIHKKGPCAEDRAVEIRLLEVTHRISFDEFKDMYESAYAYLFPMVNNG